MKEKLCIVCEHLLVRHHPAGNCMVAPCQCAGFVRQAHELPPLYEELAEALQDIFALKSDKPLWDSPPFFRAEKLLERLPRGQK